MKVKILHNSGYIELDDVEFPVVVEAHSKDDNYTPTVYVNGSELIRVGGKEHAFDPDRHYPFFLESEAVEVD